jgi:ribosomal protein S17E
MPDKKDTIDWNSIPVVDDAKTASKDNNVDWNTVPIVEDETTPQKKKSIRNYIAGQLTRLANCISE